MDMLDQALDSSSQDKTNESTVSDEGQQIQSEGQKDKREVTRNPEFYWSGLKDMNLSEGGEEQAAAIASVAPAAGLIDPTVQYQFRAENGQGGQVTYRVVQVTQGGADGSEATAQVVTTTAFPAGQQVAQAVIQSPFSNGSSPTGDGQTGGGETRFTYFPATSGTADASGTQTDATLATAATAGQFYVMMSPQEVLQSGQRNIAPRTHQFSPKADGTRTARDERRRATHNEVERRRRDKINNWIIKLSKMVPDCSQDHTKQGQVSKGGILAKTVEYIHELRTTNARMADSLKEQERLQVDVELLRQQCEEFKNENTVLRTQLQQHGIVPPDMTGSNS